MNYLILIILISQNFILFNEEFLIFVCFICFCFICLENMGNNVFNYFKFQALSIESVIVNSYKQLLFISNKQIKFNKKIINITSYFKNFKEYYIKFNFNIINNLKNLQLAKKHKLFKEKLHFSLTLEAQFSKLIILLLVSKIKKIILLHIFFNNCIKLKNFKCLNKICLLEYIISI
uniref:ATP synthase F0 subunit b n=1 Tax=Heterosiphonia pulchra TaxID=189631 RepID=UPI002E76B297|nr:ATP synthase F0 subunit b [Heterosiphonia pulchra]WQF69556.1 ATP synthase F0 subunit b [Heterosiphonia pulchra]